jgi:glycosyltransferase involved in cell wall biosynthesis
VARAAGAGGLVVPPGDAEAFGAAIRRLLSDVRLRADLARAGRVYAASNWDRETVLQAMMAQLEVSLAKPAHAQPAVAGAVMPEVARSATRE